jgi:iron complex outermembrane receptor protein
MQLWVVTHSNKHIHGWIVKSIKQNLFAFLILSLLYSTALASDHMNGLFDSSITDLTNIKVTSVSKVSENSFQSPGAVYVITSEDIRRSGAIILPEILRFVPGIDVAQISSNKWAISARGFTDQLSNKLLVLIDGRSVYSPDFSGVYWEIQDMILEDIERIEVIRGPGASLWGANAVNGVINIITKKTKDSQGTYLSTGFGNNAKNISEGRYGGQVGDSIYYRTYAKYSNWDDMEKVGGGNANDSWNMKRGGFRVDYEKSPLESLTFQGGMYNGNENSGRIIRYPTLTAPYYENYDDVNGGDVGGGNLLTRWEKNLAKDSDVKLQLYYDNARRDYAQQAVLVQTFDADFQHSIKLNSWNDFVWGLGIRYNVERTDGSVYFNYASQHSYYNTYSSFIQDKIALIAEKLYLTIGSKFENTSFTGLETEPSVKLAWNINENNMLWTSVSRAVRTPSLAEENIRLVVGVNPGPPAGYLAWQGNNELESEKLTAYEIGYKTRIRKDLSFDISTFYNDYTDLRTAEPGATFPDPNTARIYPLRNEGYGESYGVEFATNYEIQENWRLSANYSLFTLNLHLDQSSADTSLQPLEGNSPKNKINIRSLYNISKNIEFDNTIYYVDNLSSRHIPSYTRFDSKIAWRPMDIDGLEISLVGQNLFDDKHPEFTGALFSPAVEVGRSVFGKVTWRY